VRTAGWLTRTCCHSQDELEYARLELGRGSVPFWQVLDALFARAATPAI
jgi:hypothetical protein